MSILTPITKIAMIGAAAGILYFTVSPLISGRSPPTVESGFANPAYVKLEKPKNENGNLELFLTYENGSDKISLPISEGPNGPVAGNNNYLWNSISDEAKITYISEGWGGLDSEIKSYLVQENWQDLQLETRKNLLRTSLDKMIENYKGIENYMGDEIGNQEHR